MGARNLASRAKLTPGSTLWWDPAETNVTIQDGDKWFWKVTNKPRSVTQLVDVFFSSVGRNSNLIFNLSPDTRGLIPDDQLATLRRVSQVINDTFAKDLAAGGQLTADRSNPANRPALALDGNLDTWWEAAPGQTTAALTLTLPKPVTFDVLSLQEAVDHRGQRIESFAIDTWNGSAWAEAGKVTFPDDQQPGSDGRSRGTPVKVVSDELTTVGHRRLIRLASPVTTTQVRLRILGSRLEPTLAEMGLFKQAVPDAVAGN